VLRLIADLSMARKLLLLVGVYCVMAGLLLAAGAAGLSSVNQRAQDISRHNMHSAALLASINSEALRIQADVGSSALSTGPVALKAFQGRITSTDADLDTNLAQYTKTVSTPAQADAVLRFTTWWQAYRNYRDHRLMVLAGGDPAVFQSAYLGQGQLVSDRAMTALSDLLRIEQTNSARAASAARSTYRTALTAMIITMVVGLALAVVLARYLTRLIVRPVRQVAGVLAAVAGGDLTATVTITQRDEVGQMAGALATATRSMRETVQVLADTSTMMAASSEELATTSRQIGLSATDTAHRADQVAAAAEQVSRHVAVAATGTEEMSATIGEIARSTAENSVIAASAVELAGSTNRTVLKLGDSSTKIGNVVELINTIAEQTNLLALNATIEAARSGEHGKGFAVVAQEVKELAQATSQATGNITATVGAIRVDTREVAEAIRQLGEVVDQINAYQSTVASAVEEQTATTAEMSRSVAQAANGSGDIATTVGGVATAAATTNEGITAIGHAAEDMAGMASRMRTLVSHFTY